MHVEKHCSENAFNHYLNLLIALVVLIFSACAITKNVNENTEDLVAVGKVKLEMISPKGVNVYKTSVYQDNKEVLISGEARKYNQFQSGHFDVAIFDVENTLLEKTSVVAEKVMKKIKRSRSRVVKFKAKFSSTLPLGAIVKVTFHKTEPHKVTKFDCGHNKAVNNI